MILNRKLQGPGYRLSRASVFVAVGAFGFAPLIHGTMVFGLEQMMMKGFPYTLAKAACLLLGTLCYLVSHARLADQRKKAPLTQWAR